MDLVAVQPVFNLYNTEWPLYTSPPQAPPAKFVFVEVPDRDGLAFDSIVSGGTIISGGTVRRSVISPGVFVEQRALVEGSVIMDNVRIGENSIIRAGPLLTKTSRSNRVPSVGVDPEFDASRFTISAGGVVASSGRVKRSSGDPYRAIHA